MMTPEQMEQYLVTIVRTLMPTLIKRVNELEERVKGLETASEPAPAPKERRRRITYDDYQKIDNLAASGLGDKDIARELGMAYTTVRKIMRMSESEVEKLRKKSGVQESNVKLVDPVENDWTVVETEPAEEKLAARAGWRSWSMKQKEVADLSKRPSDDFPLEAPCNPTDFVDVMYMNEYVSKGLLATDVDWGCAGGVKWFKVLEKVEEPF